MSFLHHCSFLRYDNDLLRQRGVIIVATTVRRPLLSYTMDSSSDKSYLVERYMIKLLMANSSLTPSSLLMNLTSRANTILFCLHLYKQNREKSCERIGCFLVAPYVVTVHNAKSAIHLQIRPYNVWITHEKSYG